MRPFEFLRSISIKLRLTILFSVIFTTILSFFSYLLYSYFIQTHQTEFDAALYNHAVDVEEAIDFNFFGNLSIDPQVFNEQGKIFPFSLGKVLLSLRDGNGKVLGRSTRLGKTDLPLTDEDLNLLKTKGRSFRTLNPSSLLSSKSVTPYRLINYVISRPDMRGPLILQIAVPLTLLEGERIALLRFFIISIPVLVLISAILGYFFSKRALLPVNKIIEKTNKIEAFHLEERVPLPTTHDEIYHLATTINNLLDRLEISFKSQERFIADASHQLKTPLAIMRGELDLIRNKSLNEKDMKVFFESASQELLSLSRLTEDLLLLARVDSGKESLAFTDTRIDEVVLNQVTRLTKAAEKKNISLFVNFDEFQKNEFNEALLTIKADAELLGVLFYNLIENAIKYSPNGTRVEILGMTQQDKLSIQVLDQGPGIQAEMQDKIFERFFRVSQASKVGGSGLGLAIAKRLAQLHGGDLRVQNRTDTNGSIFEFTIGLHKSVEQSVS